MLPLDHSRLERLIGRLKGCFSLVGISRSPEKKELLILNGRYPVQVVSTEAQYQHCEMHGIPVLKAPLPESDEALLGELAGAFSAIWKTTPLGADDLPDTEGYNLAHELACRIEGQNCQGTNC